MKWQKYWKAIAGAIAPGVVVIVASVTSQSEGGSTITTSEWVTAVAAIILTGASVYAAPPNDYSTPVQVEMKPTPPPEEPPVPPTA
jgi:general stress protein CsbA